MNHGEEMDYQEFLQNKELVDRRNPCVNQVFSVARPLRLYLPIPHLLETWGSEALLKDDPAGFAEWAEKFLSHKG